MDTIIKLRLNYLLIPLFVIITASAASYFADTGREWYNTIQLPDWTPSDSIMVAVRTIIFVFLAVSILLIWNRNFSDRKFKLIIWQFILSSVLVVSWNIIFFTYQQIGISFFNALILFANILFLLILIWPICRIAAYLLIPYSIWVIFAAFLTLNVWIIN